MKTKKPNTTNALESRNSNKLAPATQEKLEALMKTENLQLDDLKDLSPDESLHFYDLLNKIGNASKGEERDLFLEKYAGVIEPEARQNIKDGNYINITQAIADFVKEYGRMPAKVEIAEKTGLSRQTVHKHLKEYAGSNHLESQVEQYRLMASKVVDKVLRNAVSGDMKAARLFLDTVGKLNTLTTSSNSTIINQQNNYLQINNTILNQEILQQLTPEQLRQIEEIIKGRG